MVAVATSTRDGRTRLLDSAERLFAERGVDGPSLREINSAAGQRNASGVQYHFGGRAGLLAAVIERHMSTIDAERTKWLDVLERRGEPSERELMAALVEPLEAGDELAAEQLGDDLDGEEELAARVDPSLGEIGRAHV